MTLTACFDFDCIPDFDCISDFDHMFDQAEDLVNSAAFVQLAAAEAAEAAIQARIAQQMELFEGAQRDKRALSHRMDELQVGSVKEGRGTC